MTETIVSIHSNGTHCSDDERACRHVAYAMAFCCLYHEQLQVDDEGDNLCCVECVVGQRELAELRGAQA